MVRKSRRQQPAELRDRAGAAAAHDLAAGLEQRVRVHRLEVTAPRAAPKEAALVERLEQRLEAQRVVGRHQVDGVAHERGPDRPPGAYELRELFGAEALEPCPQPNVGEIGRLGLHAHQALDRRGG